ncbi:oxygenase [Lithospermum erythrorhizon]|uniref:carotenoid 9,10-dioxygenase n=1 Tax=Lithospermum erythrorhizon TaxID=34254 RepID=A0AAV3R7N3_LITER
MLKYNDWIYNLNPLKKARFGIRPRDPKINAEVQWFEFEDPFFIFHNANSWEDGDDKVVLYGCKMSPEKAENDSIPIIKSVLLCRALVGENFTLSFPELYKFTFDLKTGEATQEIVSENKIDYPKINENYRTGKSRYVYANEFDNTGKSPAILKYDLEAEPKKCVTRIDFGGNIFGSEVVFIPSENATEEDDGYLLNYVHDEDNGKSYVNVICANEMKKVAALELPNRVPYGFHAIFIDEDDLEHQRTL